MYKYWLFSLSVLFFIFVSCSKTEEYVKKELKVLKVEMKNLQNPQDITTYDFEYPADSVIKIKLSYTYYEDFWIVYKFNTQQQLSEVRFEAINGSLLYKTDYSYNSATIVALETVDCQTPNPRLFDSTVYFRGNSGLAARSVRYTDPDGGWDPSYTCYYTWQDDELQSIVKENYPDYDTLKFIYHTGYNPVNFTDLPLMYFSGLMCGKHLCSRLQDASPANMNEDIIEYNKDDYPTKIITGMGGTEYRYEYIPK